MQRLLFVAMITCGVVADARAVAPGPLDGQDIPSDFAESKLVGVQTNRTGAGDVTDLTAVTTYTEGSELDALYLAKDSALNPAFLHVALAGNLVEVGNPFVILIDNAFDSGHTELWTEGVGGPPFALQVSGREVVVNTNGTPGDGSDDTFTVTPNSGTLLPDCGDGGFTGWDYALAIDGDGGTMFAHEYLLFDFQVGVASAGELCNFGDGRGRVPCDPTPDNPGDAALPMYALRGFVASTPIGDGNEVFDGGDGSFGYQRGGFDNSNTTGVTETDATQAAGATTGVEIAIPLANIGSGLFGDETIRILVLTLDADEFEGSPVTGEFASVINQALPSLSGDSCDPPQDLGRRPDLSTVASCLTVDLSTLGVIAASAVLEGVIVPSDYDSGAPARVQQCPTSGGDQARAADILQPVQEGSELNTLYVDNDDEFIYLGLTGNLQDGGPSINIFVDADARAANGDQLISDFSDFALDGTYQQWSNTTGTTMTSGPDSFRVESTDWGGGFKDISPNINAAGAVFLTLDFTANAANQADTVRVVLADADGTERFFDFAIPGVGTHSLSLLLTDFSFEIDPGTVPGLNLSELSFFHIAGGFNNGDPGLPLDITFDHLALSDDDSGQHVLDFNPAGAFETIEIEDFSNFNLLGTYVSWTSATITPGATDFRVEATGGFGGGFADINPNVNLSRGISVELEVTVNPASAPGGVLLVLADSDDTQLRWAWFGLAPGNSYTLTADLADGVEVLGGGVPGFDFTDVSFFHLQGDFATTDINFDNLAVNGVLPGVAAVVGMNGNALPNGPLDALDNGEFISDAAVQYDYAYGINLTYTPYLAYVDFFDLVNDTFAFRGAVQPDGGDSVLFDTPGGLVADNPNGLQMAFNNQNTTGVIGCGDEDPCFMDSAPTVSALAEQATTGVELAIPLADLGLDVSDLPRVIRVWTMVGDAVGAAADQSLPSMRNASGEGNQVSVPGRAPVNFTDPAGGPSFSALISDFSNFALTGTYDNWGTAVFTSGPDDFRVESTDWGGGFFVLDPWVDATGATQLVVDVTLNTPGNQTDKLVVILFDGDGTVRVYRFDDLSNGTQSLTVNLRDYFQEDAPGDVPGLDLANIGQFNIAGAFHNGNPGVAFDVTFDNIALVGGTRNFEARAARICLGTVAGDADCDGDNDLRDFWLFQECLGVEADPVLPMECEQLDFVKDRVINQQDFAGLAALIDGL